MVELREINGAYFLVRMDKNGRVTQRLVVR